MRRGMVEDGKSGREEKACSVICFAPSTATSTIAHVSTALVGEGKT